MKSIKMCGNANEALGMPSGSVRALLAISIIPLSVIGSITLMILLFFKEQYTSSLGILSGLTGMSGAVVGYYFGTKAADKATSEIIKSHNISMETKDALLNTKDELIAVSKEVIVNRNRELNNNILFQNNV